MTRSELGIRPIRSAPGRSTGRGDYCSRGRFKNPARSANSILRPGAPVADDLDRDLDPGLAAAPDFPVEVADVGDLSAAGARENVAAAQACGRQGSAIGHCRDDHLAAAFGRIDAEPGPAGLVDAAVGQEIAENRRQQVDRHDHVGCRTVRPAPSAVRHAVSRPREAGRPLRWPPRRPKRDKRAR